jgi:alkanesulfonate monooxygenase SsuD/methylene tetrahydromethanopterin reductase-like flavin-dependent oxidoreductase (luciferase family)
MMSKGEIIVVNDRSVLKEMGFEVPIEGSEYKYQKSLPTQEKADIAIRAAANMPDEVAARFMVIGDASQFIEKIDEYVKAGARLIIIRDVIGQYLYGSVDKARDTFEFFAKKIIPYFKGKERKKTKPS